VNVFLSCVCFCFGFFFIIIFFIFSVFDSVTLLSIGLLAHCTLLKMIRIYIQCKSYCPHTMTYRQTHTNSTTAVPEPLSGLIKHEVLFNYCNIIVILPF